MKELWSKIGFNPQTFEISEAEYIDTEDSENPGGDRKVLDTVNFPRSIDPIKMDQSEAAKFSVVRVNNFPQDISDEDVVKFISKEIEEEINISDVNFEKTKYSTNVYLGPGPSVEVLAKVIEMLDYKTTGKTFFAGGRKLHANLHRPLTPVKKEAAAVLNEFDQNKIKEKVSNLNKITGTPKLPAQNGRSSQYTMSSARKPSLDRHKGV